MVNTFVTSSNFKTSAKVLDFKRLGKQRVEAKQILDICKKLHHWANYYNIILEKWKPEQQEKTKLQIKNIVCYVKSDIKNNVIHFFDSLIGEWTIINKKPSIKIPCGKIWMLENKNIIYNKKIYKRKDVKLPNDIIGTTGFVYHPVIKMWIGFEDALSHYINCHIKEWINRGYKNNMYIIDHSDYFEIPQWVNKTSFKLHKSMLLQKEILRNEPDWYSKKTSFVSCYEYLTNYGKNIIDWEWY